MPDSNPSGEKLVPRQKLLSLVDLSDRTKKQMQSMSGTLGDAVRQAVEKNKLHAGVFRQIAKLNRMDERARDEYIDTFEAYVDMMNEERWNELRHHGDLDEQARRREAEGDGEGGKPTANGAKPRSTRKAKVDGMPTATRPRSPAADAAADLGGGGEGGGGEGGAGLPH